MMHCLKTARKLQITRWSKTLADRPCLHSCRKRLASTQERVSADETASQHVDNKLKEADTQGKKRSLPVALQYFTDDSTETDDFNVEKTENSLKMFEDSLENIKFDIENLKALKFKHQAYRRELEKVTEDPEHAAKSVLIGTPDARHTPSTVPCGGCGAFLHCNDPALPGYIPQEQFKGLKAEKLATLLCKRCTLSISSSKPVQTDVDKNTYKEIIKKIKKEKALVLMIVDVTDIANSIIPEFLHGIGKRRPIFIVGNKIDLIPKDDKGHLNRILQRLNQECERASLNPTGKNIWYTCLVSAKTGYGIEELINKLIKDWDVIGNVYLVGTTNSGKSTLFNKFLESDYCKHTCRDMVQRATVSRWPGTTINLIKFPILKATKWKMYLRTIRIKEDRIKQTEIREKRKQKLKEYGGTSNAKLFGNVGKTDFRSDEAKAKEDKKYEITGQHFTSYKFTPEEDDVKTAVSGSDKPSVLGLRKTILEEMYPDSKWTCDTPGLINENQLINQMTWEELRKILKVEMIRPRVFVMKPGEVMFVTGLARIDYLEGRLRTYVTVHTNHLLPVHVLPACDADAFYMENIGTEKLGLPIGDSKRLDMLPSLCGREFDIHMDERLRAAADLQLSSLGWVSFAGQDLYVNAHIRAYTPGGRGMHLRTPALLPNTIAFRGPRISGTKQYTMKRLRT